MPRSFFVCCFLFLCALVVSTDPALAGSCIQCIGDPQGCNRCESVFETGARECYTIGCHVCKTETTCGEPDVPDLPPIPPPSSCWCCGMWNCPCCLMAEGFSTYWDADELAPNDPWPSPDLPYSSSSTDLEIIRAEIADALGGTATQVQLMTNMFAAQVASELDSGTSGVVLDGVGLMYYARESAGGGTDFTACTFQPGGVPVPIFSVENDPGKTFFVPVIIGSRRVVVAMTAHSGHTDTLAADQAEFDNQVANVGVVGGTHTVGFAEAAGPCRPAP